MISASTFNNNTPTPQTNRYSDAATAILVSLGAKYQAGDNSEAFLAYNGHDCGSDRCSLIETDYYFLEALRRYLGAPF